MKPKFKVGDVVAVEDKYKLRYPNCKLGFVINVEINNFYEEKVFVKWQNNDDPRIIKWEAFALKKVSYIDNNKVCRNKK